MLRYTQSCSARGVSFQALQNFITKNKCQIWSISLDLYEGKPTTLTEHDSVLTVKDNLISLDAKNASLVEIVEEIGSRMKIDVIAKIPEEKKITTKFDELPLEAAIERLREFADIAYIKEL